LESKRKAEQIDFQNRIGELQKRNAVLEKRQSKKKKKNKPASKKAEDEKLAKVFNVSNILNVSNVFKPKTLQDLPPEILLKILGFCPQPDLHRHVALVSVTQFSQLSVLNSFLSLILEQFSQSYSVFSV
jgi:hypothetical protein